MTKSKNGTDSQMRERKPTSQTKPPSDSPKEVPPPAKKDADKNGDRIHVATCLCLVILLMMLLIFIGVTAYSTFRLMGGSGSRTSNQSNKRTNDLQTGLTVSLEDVYFGNAVTFNRARTLLCDKCHGNGLKPGVEAKKCEACRGTGEAIQRERFGHITYERQVRCNVCKGRGVHVHPGDKCTQCDGLGHSKKSAPVKFLVPKGLPEGQQTIAKGYADEHYGYETGDLYIFITTTPHKFFKRKDNDHIEITVEISLLEALTGFKRKITHISGETLTLRRSEISSPGDVIIMEGRGMPIFGKEGQFGNLYINLQVKFPSTLSAEQITGFKEVLAGQQ